MVTEPICKPSEFLGAEERGDPAGGKVVTGSQCGTIAFVGCDDVVVAVYVIGDVTRDGVDTGWYQIQYGNGVGYVWEDWFDVNQFPLNKSMENIRQSLDALLPIAEELKIAICIENIWYPTSTVDQLLQIKELFPTGALGFTYDAGHANLMDKGRNYDECAARKGWKASGFDDVPWEDHALEKMLPHVVNCHLHDNYGQWDEHRCPGHGNVDWPHVLGLLKQAPRLKNLQSEVIPCARHEALCDITAAFRERLAAADFPTDA